MFSAYIEGHKNILDCLDRSFRDTRNNISTPMGGLPVLMAGDFRQLLPIIERAGESEIVTCSLKYSKLWREGHVEEFNLTINERVRRKLREGDADAAKTLQKWSSFLLRVGEVNHNSNINFSNEEKIEGKEPTNDDGEITIPRQCLAQTSTIDELIHEIFPHLNQGQTDPNVILIQRFKKQIVG